MPFLGVSIVNDWLSIRCTLSITPTALSNACILSR
jgi:hypothetical protein